MRRQPAAQKAATSRAVPRSRDDVFQGKRAEAIAFLHRTLGNRRVARVLGGGAKTSKLRVAANDMGAIQREVSDEEARMKEAFRKGGITEDMISGERRGGFIDYDEDKGVARWVPVQIAHQGTKPSAGDDEARMKEAFRKGGITEEMISGERRDGFLVYDEATGTARWEKITFAVPKKRRPKKR